MLATTSYDDVQHTFALNADSPYAGNAYVVGLPCASVRVRRGIGLSVEARVCVRRGIGVGVRSLFY